MEDVHKAGSRAFTRQSLRDTLIAIRDRGWIATQRPGNDGGVGNTLEDLLGIPENNISTADAGEFEIKSHARDSSSLVTLFHKDPLPRGRNTVVQHVLVANYGWPHETLPNERSFRATIRGDRPTDRGFSVVVDREKSRLRLSFDSNRIDPRHSNWLQTVRERVGNLDDFAHPPYWSFDKLDSVTKSKLPNVIFVEAEKKTNGGVQFRYVNAQLLQQYSFERFLTAIEQGYVYVDFDARTGHNHGTKFRVRADSWPQFYKIRERLY